MPLPHAACCYASRAVTTHAARLTVACDPASASPPRACGLVRLAERLRLGAGARLQPIVVRQAVGGGWQQHGQHHVLRGGQQTAQDSANRMAGVPLAIHSQLHRRPAAALHQLPAMQVPALHQPWPTCPQHTVQLGMAGLQVGVAAHLASCPNHHAGSQGKLGPLVPAGARQSDV